MGVDTHGMTEVQAAEAALAAGVRLLRDVGIPERFVDVTHDSYSKNRLGQGPTKFYENANGHQGRRRRTSTASPTTSSATPARPATPRNAPSRRCGPWSSTA